MTVLILATVDWNRLGGFFVDSVDPAFMGQLFDRVEVESQRENEAQISHAFIRDASCLNVINEQEARYADPTVIGHRSGKPRWARRRSPYEPR